MKTGGVIFLVTGILFFGCASMKESERITVIAVTDFTPYASQGFLFTPEQYLGDYESAGLLKEYVWPAIRKRVSGSEIDEVHWSLWNIQGAYWEIERLDTRSVIDSFYVKARSLGADAVMRFTITPSASLGPEGSTLVFYEASGFAIKRKSAH